jgi:CDP-diacylglycerol--glycerol-3-phosphate 3-phosphatidyltransferase
VFDGALARRWGTVTSTLRRMDSAVDMLFCLAALGAVWLCRPAVIRDAGILLVVLLCLEVLRYAVDLTKFGREASYHMWSSKLWAAVLYLSFFMVLVLGESGGWVTAVLLLGIVSDLEGLMVSLVLPEWHYDVPSLVHAWRLRHSSR